eukprot:g28347.t1
MAMKVLQAFLYLCIFDQSSGQPIQVGTYVTQDDLDMASQAAAKAEQACAIASSMTIEDHGICAQEGFDVTNCAAATLVNSTFTGQSDPYFLGLIPVLSIFDELEGSLSSGSSFINDLRAILLDTSVITDSVAVATENVNLLASMLSDTRNTAPAGTLHECLACTPLATSLSQARVPFCTGPTNLVNRLVPGEVSNALSSGTAAALSAARVEVDNQLSGSSLTTLRASLTGATAPLVELKTTIKSAFAPFVSDTLMEQISEQLNANGSPGINIASKPSPVKLSFSVAALLASMT